jgi:aryl-alcohol dehydrogenase-like predicted oxidoreductase
MHTRRLGSFTVSAIGLGCMSMSQGYGKPDRAESERALKRALDIGYTFLDTASAYGEGHNESLIGEVLGARRKEFVLASKCGIYHGSATGMQIDCSPARIKQTCADSLRRLKTDCIDLYYLHRLDKQVPIEDSVGAMAELVREGKIRAIGLSEMSARTIRRAHAVHPITALQSEYSLCTRVPEGKILDTCRELGITFVAFSPLGRSLLSGVVGKTTTYDADDFRPTFPRFLGDNLTHNLGVLAEFAELARANRCTMSQLALAWVLAQHDRDIIPIPGTKHTTFVEENAAAAELRINDADLRRAGELINEQTIRGERYNPTRAGTIDTDD